MQFDKLQEKVDVRENLFDIVVYFKFFEFYIKNNYV